MSEGRSGRSASSDAELEALLESSLGARALQPLYSVRAGFMVAFFGGVYAALGFSLLNARRLGRLRAELWVAGGLAALWTVCLVASSMLLARGELALWIPFVPEQQPGRVLRYGARAAALLVFGFEYLRRAPYYRAAALLGEESPSPWQPGLLAVGAGALLNAAAVAAGTLWGRA